MHRTLYIQEILLNIFHHCSPPTTSLPERRSNNADLAVLARVCKAFKEPALDILWEELDDLSPLARCLPDACCLWDKQPQSSARQYCPSGKRYMFRRPLKEAEWNTLRGYTSRVRFICNFETLFGGLSECAIRVVFAFSPFVMDPLFPKLRSLYWQEITPFPALQVATPSLTSLHLDFTHVFMMQDIPVSTESFINTFGDRCRRLENVIVVIHSSAVVDSAISRQVSRWPKLQRLFCRNTELSSQAILYLSSATNLKCLWFTANPDAIQAISNLGSKLVFSNLTDLHIRSTSLATITSLLSHTQLPAINSLAASAQNLGLRQAAQAYWDAVREVCPPNLLTNLDLVVFPIPTPRYQARQELFTVVDLFPRTTCSYLRRFHVSFPGRVNLTDADLLELVSPHTEQVIINAGLGWKLRRNGGITLRGLVQLLNKCPSLNKVSIAIDTETFTRIPEGLDVSFPPRQGLKLDFVDSHILPGFAPGIASVFLALGLRNSMFNAWGLSNRGFQTQRGIWLRVRIALMMARGELDLSS